MAIALIASWLKGVQGLDILPLMLVLLLGAIPVILTAMFTVCTALGSKEVVKEGVLITRLNAPDDAASMDILCVDKTDTLTIRDKVVANEWKEYMHVYNMIVNTYNCPDWKIIPADKRWFRNYAVGRALADCLESLHLKYLKK